MFNVNIIKYASRFWSCTTASLRRGMWQNSRLPSHRFLSSAKIEKQLSDTDINAEIAAVKECKAPTKVSNHKRYSYIKNFSHFLSLSMSSKFYSTNYNGFLLSFSNASLGKKGSGKAEVADCSNISLEPRETRCKTIHATIQH